MIQVIGNATVTFNGNASLSTAQSKFGGSSLYLDGTGDSVSISDTYWNTAINSGDFTIELWVRFTVDEISHPLHNKPSGSGNMGWGIQRYASANLQGQIIFWFRYSGGWQYLNYAQGTRTTISQNTWYHVAVTRNGKYLEAFSEWNSRRYGNKQQLYRRKYRWGVDDGGISVL